MTSLKIEGIVKWRDLKLQGQLYINSMHLTVNDSAESLRQTALKNKMPELRPVGT